MTSSHEIQAIDATVNIWTKEALAGRPDRRKFYTEKMHVNADPVEGLSIPDMLARMDAAGTERAFLIAAKVGQLGPSACYHVPYRLVADAVQAHPDRFLGIAGLDPTEGMAGVRAFEKSVKEYGFIGGHFY